MPRKFLGGTPTVDGTALVKTDDSRLSDARTPTAHKTSHATGGSDALSASDIGAIAVTLADAKGDLLVASGNDAFAKLTVGTDTYVLTADSTATNGVKWAAASGGGGSTSFATLLKWGND